jgi:hypothetical protein
MSSIAFRTRKRLLPLLHAWDGIRDEGPKYRIIIGLVALSDSLAASSGLRQDSWLYYFIHCCSITWHTFLLARFSWNVWRSDIHEKRPNQFIPLGKFLFYTCGVYSLMKMTPLAMEAWWMVLEIQQSLDFVPLLSFAFVLNLTFWIMSMILKIVFSAYFWSYMAGAWIFGLMSWIMAFCNLIWPGNVLFY